MRILSIQITGKCLFTLHAINHIDLFNKSESFFFFFTIINFPVIKLQLVLQPLQIDRVNHEQKEILATFATSLCFY